MQAASHSPRIPSRRKASGPVGALAGLVLALSTAGGTAHGSASTPLPDESQKALKRIFTLEGGATVRTVARQSDGVWEVQQGGAWAPAPWSIETMRLEREVLAEMRRLDSRLRDDAPAAQRCEFADWMLRNGLILEALQVLDPLINSDAGMVDDSVVETPRTCASSTLERHAFRFALPAAVPGDPDARTALEPIFEYGSAASPAMRDLCVQQLAGHADGEGTRTALGDDLLNSSPARRSWAAFALGQRFPGSHLPDLLQRAVLDPSNDVRASAQSALRAAREPGLVSPIVRALEGSTSSKVRVHAAQALGHMGYAAAVPSLIARLATLEGAQGMAVPHSNIFVGRQAAYLQDFDVEVSQGQAVADPQLNVLVEGQVTDVGVISVQQVSTERRAVRGALEQLAGERVGRTSKAWTDWWNNYRERSGTSAHGDR